MAGALEGEQQRVATELHRVSAEIAGRLDERRDHAVEDVDELLDPRLAALGQALGQRCEAGDVEEQQAALLLAPLAARVGREPRAMQLAQVRAQLSCHLLILTDGAAVVQPGAAS